MTKIVLIDDSTLACGWLVESSAPLGYEVLTHSTFVGTNAFVRRNKPDLVLLDVNMPGLDGTAACKLLRRYPETAGVVITLYSSMDEDELRSRAAACGADGFIRKTHDARGLVTAIEGLLATTAN